MTKYLPIMLDLDHRPVAVIGGGSVAERKIAGLLECGAAVTLISPEATEGLMLLAERGRLDWRRRSYAPGDLAGAALVYAATGDAGVDAAVAAEAAAQGAPVNVASGAAAGSFITPAVVRRGRLTVAVSTSGAGPAAAARITAQLADMLGEEYEPYLDFLHEMRSEIKRREPSPEIRGRLLRRLGQLEVLDELKRGTFVPWSAAEMAAWIAANRE